MNLDLEEYLMDEYKREGLIAEVIVQELLKGTAVDIEDAKRHLKHEHWKGVVAEYAEKMN